jgi:glycosyltransferase involved in cell wall biosynthesis
MLLVTGVAPGRGGVGREYLRAACRLLPADRVAVFSLDPEGQAKADPDLSGVEIHHEPAPDKRDRVGRGETRWGWVRHLAERRIERTAIPPLVEKIAAFGRRSGAESVWVPLHSPTTIRVARPVAEALGLPLRVTVWDPPNDKLRQWGIGRRMRGSLLRTFDATVRHARACSAASDPMRDLYRRLYGTPTVTMILGAPRPELLGAPRDQGPFRIGFAGALYASREFDSLCGALDRAGWLLAGREVRVEMFGDHEQQAAARSGRVRSHGWRDPADMVRGLSRCDLAYLPYWFTRRRREVVEVSFPGKLAAYAAARTPVLYHGPSYASPVRFLERHPMGRVCATLSTREVQAALQAMAGDPAWRRRAREACDRAYESELSAAVFRRRFAEFLGVGVEDLLVLDACRSTV